MNQQSFTAQNMLVKVACEFNFSNSNKILKNVCIFISFSYDIHKMLVTIACDFQLSISVISMDNVVIIVVNCWGSYTTNAAIVACEFHCNQVLNRKCL